jgi:hypothetical protein
MTRAVRIEIPASGAPVVTPSWLDGARRHSARRRRPGEHGDGTCDALYPGTSLDRDGRCLLAAGHAGAHVYRGHGPVRKPTRQRAYEAEREERKRLARLALRRERRERAATVA